MQASGVLSRGAVQTAPRLFLPAVTRDTCGAWPAREARPSLDVQRLYSDPADHIHLADRGLWPPGVQMVLWELRAVRGPGLWFSFLRILVCLWYQGISWPQNKLASVLSSPVFWKTERSVLILQMFSHSEPPASGLFFVGSIY